jgi:hypothetical protein
MSSFYKKAFLHPSIQRLTPEKRAGPPATQRRKPRAPGAHSAQPHTGVRVGLSCRARQWPRHQGKPPPRPPPPPAPPRAPSHAPAPRLAQPRPQRLRPSRCERRAQRRASRAGRARQPTCQAARGGTRPLRPHASAALARARRQQPLVVGAVRWLLRAADRSAGTHFQTAAPPPCPSAPHMTHAARAPAGRGGHTRRHRGIAAVARRPRGGAAAAAGRCVSAPAPGALPGCRPCCYP